MSNDDTQEGPALSRRAAESLATAAVFCEGERLPLPPIPASLAPDFAQWGEWHWGTDDKWLVDRAGFIANAADLGSERVAFGYTGHGVNSWHLIYQLAIGRLAVFVRTGYGGPYRDNDAARADFAKAMSETEALIEAAEADEVYLAPGQRILVLLDERGQSAWGIVGAGTSWQVSADPAGAALAALTVFASA